MALPDAVSEVDPDLVDPPRRRTSSWRPRWERQGRLRSVSLPLRSRRRNPELSGPLGEPVGVADRVGEAKPCEDDVGDRADRVPATPGRADGGELADASAQAQAQRVGMWRIVPAGRAPGEAKSSALAANTTARQRYKKKKSQFLSLSLVLVIKL